MKVFIATGNKKKIDEIKPLLKDFEVLSIADGINIPEVEENSDTFEGNSQKKALEIAKFLNMVAIADDSGLMVDALEGEPGVYSARYAGENANDSDNNKKLIQNLKGIGNRKAKFVSVISVAKPNGEVHSFRGEVEGLILDEARGNSGFGYDPYFYYVAYGKTFAELELSEKNAISHRARALSKMKKEIKDILKTEN
ncbi:MAG: XTP/dITP diphosphatase [Fusobacteriaceae bacterium]|jgi:non-canonical purine NTP pyrophosphatase (RdgB/HAM1 family)|nr:XTP/dITP diphosphatase [Fusobacteriaceae bacterium]MBP6466836.1 XTP/dITP diphosphatase [Fusobacteriaceae bacterium]MBP9596342.1 XTP/dITP diphosphatase [Fusobacteriaceae bacterium]MBU9917826.1 XTP/dITP diphosphatase [Fusobacteriaceae bacterium]